MTFEPTEEIVEIGARFLAGLTNDQPWPSPLQLSDTLAQTPDTRFHTAMTAESTAFLLAVGPLIYAAALNRAADIINGKWTIPTLKTDPNS
ncbi:hypothetical protein SAMN04489740_4341 [Arthrobacter alpinus]|uniref:Uncharacterized protein n=1 Tax=Arthrobacter alpinus TaxID=656366 RepID=A0A1H5PJH9_9MICC|nr:hypothetical protein [Arthrobacter alpinus]SEF13177.1 hypothetical protein SAMN04489740_4341 [Arthrobacter alpinus]